MDIVLKAQLNLLIHLAMIDGKVTDQERQMITQIAEKNNFDPLELETMFQYPKPMESFGALTSDAKFDYLYQVVRLMNIDDDVDRRELLFCQDMAMRLGYRKEVIDELWTALVDDSNLKMDREALKNKVQRYNPFI
ncbi:MAG: TerB family tellurite resistance protein [Cyclobacteriaceae bacterium]